MTQRKLFGTDGIRGKAGEAPLDDETIRAIGRALARTLASRLGRAPRVVVGRDTRASGPLVENALAAGILAEGGKVDGSGVLTTPGVAYVTRVEGYDAGIVVSASHNPYRDNGIKVFSPTGQKLDEEAERQIEALVPEVRGVTTDSVEPLVEDARHAECYFDYLHSTVAGGVDLTGLKLVIDCANGAAYALAPRLFSALGAEVFAIGVSPNGRNINEGCGSLYLDALCHEVVACRADIGIAFDGDADRALFADGTGNAVDGDQAMCLLALDMDARGRLEGRRVVATVMSNIGLELALEAHGISLVRAQVGDKYVLDELLRNGGSLGGEQSGHLIFPQISLAGDGMTTAIEVLGAMRRSGRSLAALAGAMQRYPQVLVNVAVREKRPFDQLHLAAGVAASVERELEGKGRLLLRYSGTENLARVMIEGPDHDAIAEQAERIADAILAELG